MQGYKMQCHVFDMMYSNILLGFFNIEVYLKIILLPSTHLTLEITLKWIEDKRKSSFATACVYRMSIGVKIFIETKIISMSQACISPEMYELQFRTYIKTET